MLVQIYDSTVEPENNLNLTTIINYLSRSQQTTIVLWSGNTDYKILQHLGHDNYNCLNISTTNDNNDGNFYLKLTNMHKNILCLQYF